MKKSLLLAAALFATSSAFAVDMYMVGADVNGSSWALAQPDAKMTEKSSGVYEWEGQTLGSNFKINDGTWDAAYNIGMGDDGKIKLDVPYHYYMGDGSGDIAFDGFDLVTNPKVVLDMNAGTITLSGTPSEKEPVDPSELTFYMIGSNVNGQSWALAQPDAAFDNLGNGRYRWEGQVLGTGFKINDGTWSNEQYNIGGTDGYDLVIDEPYYYWANGSSGNIAISGYTEVLNPVVVLDLNEGTITLSGEATGMASWYIAGVNNNYDLDEATLLIPVDGLDNIFANDIYIVEQVGQCKVSDNGWAHQYGTNLPEEVYLDADHLDLQLEPVSGEGGNIPYELAEGTYNFKFNLDELTLTVTDAAGVETVLMGNDKNAVYYNLQGMKINNPTEGIFVKVANGKAQKVIIRK